MKNLRLIVYVLTTLGALTSAAQASSDDAARAAARLLGERGVEAYWAHDYAAASSNLEKAYQLFATPTLGLCVVSLLLARKERETRAGVSWNGGPTGASVRGCF